MANSKYRCQFCKQYFPRGDEQRFGLGYKCPDCRPSSPGGETRSRATSSTIPSGVRDAVVARDRGRCRFCGEGNAQLHHIEYRSGGGQHTYENLVSLCEGHHKLIHSNKKVWVPILQGLLKDGRPLTVLQYVRILSELLEPEPQS